MSDPRDLKLAGQQQYNFPVNKISGNFKCC